VPEIKRYYVNESGINKYMFREYAYALRGVKIEGKIPGKKYARVNIVAA